MSEDLHAKFHEKKDQLPGKGFYADLAGPFRFIGYFFFAITAIVATVAIWNMAANDGSFDIGTGVTLIVLSTIGIGCRRAAKFFAAGGEPDFAKVGFWAFAGFGGLMVMVGIAIAFDDPAGFFACAFGAVFIGIGFLLRKLLTTPEGMKRITVSGSSVEVSSGVVATTRGTHTRSVSILVDENATPEEVALERTRWATRHWMARPDWVSGQIVTEASRSRGGLAVVAVIMLVVESIMVTLAMIYGDFWWWMTFVVGIIATIAVGGAVHDMWHRRKFAESLLVLEQSPMRLGGELRAELRSGVPVGAQSHSPYKITFECVHQWERTTGTGKNRRTTLETETLWKQEIEGDARTELTTHQCVPIEMQIPDDQPETSLGETREGNFWLLRVHLPLPGLDYRAKFMLPVLSPDTLVDPAVMPKSD